MLVTVTSLMPRARAKMCGDTLGGFEQDIGTSNFAGGSGSSHCLEELAFLISQLYSMFTHGFASCFYEWGHDTRRLMRGEVWT